MCQNVDGAVPVRVLLSSEPAVLWGHRVNSKVAVGQPLLLPHDHYVPDHEVARECRVGALAKSGQNGFGGDLVLRKVGFLETSRTLVPARPELLNCSFFFR